MLLIWFLIKSFCRCCSVLSAILKQIMGHITATFYAMIGKKLFNNKNTDYKGFFKHLKLFTFVTYFNLKKLQRKQRKAKIKCVYPKSLNAFLKCILIRSRTPCELAQPKCLRARVWNKHIIALSKTQIFNWIWLSTTSSSILSSAKNWYKWPYSFAIANLKS